MLILYVNNPTNKIMINLTPHVINETQTSSSFPTSGIIARVEQQTIAQPELVEGATVYAVVFGTVEFSAPLEPVEGEWYIVSAMCCAGLANQYPESNWVSPGTLVRNEQGQPVGCNGFHLPQAD